MADFNKFNSLGEALAEGKHNFATATLKVVLTNSAPLAANTVLADITQVANGNGYTTGGGTAALVSSGQTGGVYRLIVDPVLWTASGSVGPFRYAVLYNDSATNDELIGWWDRGSSLTLNNGETFTWTPDDTNGVLSIT